MIPLDPEIIEMIRRMLTAGFSPEQIVTLTCPWERDPFHAMIESTAHQLAQEMQKKAVPGTPVSSTAL
jgi:hypothetical protein